MKPFAHTNRETPRGRARTFLTATLLPGLLGFFACTNYSVDSQIVNPPIITNIATHENGHLFTVAAQNIEIGFVGYRLFQGTSEDDARNEETAESFDCGPIDTVPTQAIDYFIEAQAGKITVDSDDTDFICVFNTTLTPGRYVVIRSLIVEDLVNTGTSIASNAVIVP